MVPEELIIILDGRYLTIIIQIEASDHDPLNDYIWKATAFEGQWTVWINNKFGWSVNLICICRVLDTQVVLIHLVLIQ